MTDPYNAIVIGGGHNGLVAGAYLAKAGARTVVLEARSKTGGAVDTSAHRRTVRRCTPRPLDLRGATTESGEAGSGEDILSIVGAEGGPTKRYLREAPSVSC